MTHSSLPLTLSLLLLLPGCGIVQLGLGAAGEVRKAAATKPTPGTWAVTETITDDSCGLKAALLSPTVTLSIEGEDLIVEELRARRHLDGSGRLDLHASRSIDFRPDYECTVSEMMRIEGAIGETEMDLTIDYHLLVAAPRACSEAIKTKLGYADPDCTAVGTVKLVLQPK